MLPAASNEELIEFCNKVREAGGGKPLDALLPGIPMDSKACLIANNLNFHCQVGGCVGDGVTPADQNLISKVASEEGWFMSVTDRTTRDKIAAALDLKTCDSIEEEYDWDKQKTVRTEWFSVLLPKKIGNVAHNFDESCEAFVSDYKWQMEKAESAPDWNEERDLEAAHAKAWKVASEGYTTAMKRYAKLTTVVEHG